MHRSRFAEVSYLRPGKKGAAEHVETSVFFLVDGWALARPDAPAAEAVRSAQGAAAAEAAAEQEVADAEVALKAAEEVWHFFFPLQCTVQCTRCV